MKRFLALVNTSAVVGFVIGITVAFGFNTVTDLNPSSQETSAACLYSAAQQQTRDDSWKLLPACKNLEPWQLLGIQATLSNMRSN
jgi:hypothetical protein